MIHNIQLTREEKGTKLTYQGWGLEGPRPSLPYAGRGEKDDSNVAPFSYEYAGCIHPPFVKCYAIQVFSVASNFIGKLMPKEKNQIMMRKVCAAVIQSLLSHRPNHHTFLTFSWRDKIFLNVINVVQH